METKKKNLTLRGETVLPGGEYEQVQIHGKGTIHGDLTCRSFTMNGYGQLKGALTAKDKTGLIGKTVVEQSLQVQQISSVGITDVKQSVRCQELRNKGRLVIGQNLSSDTVHNKGTLNVGGDCEADAFSSEGQLTIGGLLNADEIQITVHNESQVKEIGGKKITIWRRKASRLARMWDSLLSNLKPSSEDRFTSDLIEGDDIYLEYTQVKTVRGNRVKIGPGCQIQALEYKESFKQDDDATVVEIKQL